MNTTWIVLLVFFAIVVFGVLLHQHLSQRQRRYERLLERAMWMEEALDSLSHNSGYENLRLARILLDEVGRRPSAQGDWLLINKDEIAHLHRVVGKGMHVAAELENQAWSNRLLRPKPQPPENDPITPRRSSPHVKPH